MSSILDHVEQAVPRATVYGAMKGSPVFIGKYFRDINPASNATSYRWSTGERRVSFVVASPDKTVFNDLRSSYVKFDVIDVSAAAIDVGGGLTKQGKISEPASNIFGRIVIKMNGTVIEDISSFDKLQSFFKRSLLTRSEKNARSREGWDYVNHLDAAGDIGTQATAEVVGHNLPVATTLIEARGVRGDRLTVKLDLSGIFNIQQLLSGYYSPLEIDLYLQDPGQSCQAGGPVNYDALAAPFTDVGISNVKLGMEQIVMSPEYVAAFEAALLANSSAQGIQIPFTTYYTYRQNIDANQESGSTTTFWIRRPVRYLKGVYWAAYPSDYELKSADSYRPARVWPGEDRKTGIIQNPPTDDRNPSLTAWQVAVGTKNYRKIDDATGLKSDNHVIQFHCHESQVMFAKAVGHYNDYATETDEFTASQRIINNAVQGIDLEFSPDNDVLASETTLNSNDVRLELTHGIAAGQNKYYHVYTFLQYQASIALFPGNETRLLVT